MMGQDTFLQMVTEFCKAGEGEGNMLPSTSQRGAFCGISMLSHDSTRAVGKCASRVVFTGGLSLLDLKSSVSPSCRVESSF